MRFCIVHFKKTKWTFAVFMSSFSVLEKCNFSFICSSLALIIETIMKVSVFFFLCVSYSFYFDILIGGGRGCLTGNLSTPDMVPLDFFQGRGLHATEERVWFFPYSCVVGL